MTIARQLGCSLALLVCAIFSARAQDIDRSSLIRLSSALVKIEALTGDSALSLGTGVTVAPGRVVTSCHVTRSAETITVMRGGLRFRAVKQFADVEHDACLLTVPRLDALPAEIGAASALTPGQQVSALGFEGGVGLQVRVGKITAMHLHDGNRVLRTSTPFTSGASGGGLFDKTGKLIGLLTFHQRGTDGTYFSIPVEWFASNINNVEGYQAIAPLALDGKAFWQRSYDKLPFFMQANSLAVDRKWDALLQLASRWSQLDKNSIEPWLARGSAYTGLAQHDEAAASYHAALKLNPKAGEALYGLANLYAQRGDSEKFKLTEQQLRLINPELAQELATQTNHKQSLSTPSKS